MGVLDPPRTKKQFQILPKGFPGTRRLLTTTSPIFRNHRFGGCTAPGHQTPLQKAGREAVQTSEIDDLWISENHGSCGVGFWGVVGPIGVKSKVSGPLPPSTPQGPTPHVAPHWRTDLSYFSSAGSDAMGHICETIESTPLLIAR